jgi:hypothetical protein
MIRYKYLLVWLFGVRPVFNVWSGLHMFLKNTPPWFTAVWAVIFFFERDKDKYLLFEAYMFSGKSHAYFRLN